MRKARPRTPTRAWGPRPGRGRTRPRRPPCARARQAPPGAPYPCPPPLVSPPSGRVAGVISVPRTVTGNLDKPVSIDVDKAFQEMRQDSREGSSNPYVNPIEAPASGAAPSNEANPDPMQGLINSMKRNPAPTKP